MSQISYGTVLMAVAPESVLALVALAVLASDLLFLRGESLAVRRLVGAILTTVGAAVGVFWLAVSHGGVGVEGGMLVVTPAGTLVRQALLVLVAFTAWVAVEAEFTDHPGEFFALLMFGTVGLMLMSASENLVMIFVGLEMASLTSYALTAIGKRESKGAEAALKYFLFGGMASAVTVYGLSLLYGATGSLELQAMGTAIEGRRLDALLALGIVMSVAGFGFKVAAVPFHLWAPDAYEGAPTPSGAFIASGSKVASLVVLAKLGAIGLVAVSGSAAWGSKEPGWMPVLAMMSVASMVVGNLAALAQKDLKRLLAYSAVAHAGYGLVGVLAGTPTGMAAVVYFGVTYALTTVGVFGCIAVVERATGSCRIDSLVGLSRRAPFIAGLLLLFVLSLAGVPPLPGFFGKFYLFASVLGAKPGNLGMVWLVVLAIGFSTVSFYYYLQVLKRAHVTESESVRGMIPVPLSSRLALGILAALVVGAGLCPDALIGPMVTELLVVSH